MATAGDVIAAALARIGVVAAGEPVIAADAADGLAALNDLLHGLALQGVDISHADLALADPVLLPASHREGLKAMLAVRLAPLYEREASPTTRAMAWEAESLLRTHYDATEAMEIDAALRTLPSRRWGRGGSHD